MAAVCWMRAVWSILTCALWIGSVLAYNPAQATNRTDLVSETNSLIQIGWSYGSYNVPVSFQLTGSGSLGYSSVSAPLGFLELPQFIAIVTGCDRSLQRVQRRRSSVIVAIHRAHLL